MKNLQLTKELDKFYEMMKASSGEVEIYKVFDEFLIRAKVEKGITVKQITAETKVSSSSISGFRNNKQGLTVESLEKVINCVLRK